MSTPRGLARYRDHIVCRHPELAGEALRLIAGEGQYNDVVVVGERLVFRFPRFPEGAARLPALAHLLRAVRRHVPLATPDPLFVHLAPPEVGCAYLAYSLLPGAPLTGDQVDALTGGAARRDLATQLAAFLAALHAVPAAEALPEGERAVAAFDPRAAWAGLYARIEARLFPAMRPDARRDVAAHFEAFLGDPRTAALRPALVHGDFGLDALWDAYPGGAALRERARFYRGTFALQEALYGIEHRDAEAFARSIAPYQ